MRARNVAIMDESIRLLKKLLLKTEQVFVMKYDLGISEDCLGCLFLLDDKLV